MGGCLPHCATQCCLAATSMHSWPTHCNAPLSCGIRCPGPGRQAAAAHQQPEQLQVSAAAAACVGLHVLHALMAGSGGSAVSIPAVYTVRSRTDRMILCCAFYQKPNRHHACQVDSLQAALATADGQQPLLRAWSLCCICVTDVASGAWIGTQPPAVNQSAAQNTKQLASTAHIHHTGSSNCYE
jgi:hypothetical protein